MDTRMLILCVFPTIVLPITVSSNGNSPETKMIGGMRVDTSIKEDINPKIIMNNTRHQAYNIPKLAINERYRRLIPYMTFYYANDVVPPTTNGNVRNAENVAVDKAVILESSSDRPSEREPKLIYKPHRYKNIPRYNGNRLTQFNIASSNPTKIFYKEIPVLYQNSPKAVPHYNNHRLEDEQFDNRDVPFDHYIPTQIKAPSTPFTVPQRKPSLNIYQHEDFSPNVQYYSSDQQETPKYRLIPYDQTPPVKVIDTSKKYYNPAPVISKESFFVKPRPILRPQAFYENHNSQQLPQQTRKPATISEVYYERQPASALVEPVVESGFKPIYKNPPEVTKSPIYTSSVQEDELSYHNYHIENQKNPVVDSTLDVPRDNSYKQQYIIEQPTVPEPTQKQETSNSVTLAELLNSLQINKSIPKPITRENVGDSIRTLLNVLSTLKAAPLQNEGVAVVSTPKPFEPPEISHVTPLNSVSSTTPKAEEPDEESYLAPIQTPSQYLDDYPTSSGSTQRFPLPVTSDEEGGTPGRPGIDYPILTVIPTTKFNCKTQRYKGFFADTETRCQVWHYCDLNGGQASFLCPNGTIFSQAALTCDWWFNVRCASTTQLYVLNESLYKYILPHSPKFPEDYSGPLVDKYLTLKFKEMEEQFKKNKKKTTEKNDSGENESTEKISSAEDSTISEKDNESSINRADVIIETPGNSGNVQRLQDE